MENPFIVFEAWYQQQLAVSKAKLPAACCFTTIGEDGFPNSRFVSLKALRQEAFVITGPLNSRKGYDIAHTPKVSLCFWWRETERQVRIQGLAEQIPTAAAEAYFAKRNRASQIVSSVFEQGKAIPSFEALTTRFEEGKRQYENAEIAKPKSWSGFYLKPTSIEFMEFMATRLHKRTLYTQQAQGWTKCYLQP